MRFVVRSKNIEADWAAAFQSPLVRFVTLTDPLNFDYRLFFALITDAFRSGANAISVRCGESGVIVSYDNSPETQLREVMPSRHWHQILAGVHTVSARYAMDEQIHAALDQNFLALTKSFPDFDAFALCRSQLARYRRDCELNIQIAFS